MPKERAPNAPNPQEYTPGWAEAVYARSHVPIRGRVQGAPLRRAEAALAAAYWQERRRREPELAEGDDVPIVYGYRVEPWRTSWPAETTEAERHQPSLTFKAPTDALAFRGIHEGDEVMVSTQWEPVLGEVVLAHRAGGTEAGGEQWFVGVYGRDDAGEFLANDGPPPYWHRQACWGPFQTIYPVVLVWHEQRALQPFCLDRYPPEWFQPWWEAAQRDRETVLRGELPAFTPPALEPVEAAG